MERRRQQRAAEAQGGANDDPAATPTTTESSTASTTSTTLSTSVTINTETILYTPRPGRSRRTRSAQDQTIMDAATSSGSSTSKSKKKKRSKDDDGDDDSDDDYMDPQPSSSLPRATPGRIRVLFCTKCKCRFIRNTSDTSEETMCPSCVSGKEPVSDKSSKKRLHTHGGNKKAWYMHGVQTATMIPSLQDICVKVSMHAYRELGEVEMLIIYRLCYYIPLGYYRSYRRCRGSWRYQRYEYGQDCQDYLPQPPVDQSHRPALYATPHQRTLLV